MCSQHYHEGMCKGGTLRDVACIAQCHNQACLSLLSLSSMSPFSKGVFTSMLSCLERSVFCNMLQPIGAAAAAASGQHVAAMLGAVPGVSPCQERINATIASMTPMQVFEVMSQVRSGALPHLLRAVGGWC